MRSEFSRQFNEITDNKFDFVQLVGVDINVYKQTIDVKLIYPENKTETVNAHREEILSAAAKVINTSATLNIHLSAAKFDLELCRNAVAEFLSGYPSVVPFVDKQAIDFVPEENSDRIVLRIPAESDACEYCSERKIAGELKEYLKLYFTEDIKPEFIRSDAMDAKIDEVSIDDDGAFVFRSEGERIIKPLDIKECVGKPINEAAIYIEDCYSHVEGTIVICGKVSSFRESQKADGSKTFYKFVLSDYTGNIDCLIFLNKTMTQEKVAAVTDGAEIVIKGQLKENSFRGEKSYSVFVRSLSFCRLPEDFVKKEIYRVTPTEYQTVFPQPYIETSQVNLFDVKKTEEVPAYLVGKTYVVFDMETTGLDIASCKVTELGAVKIVDGRFTETFSSLVNPGEKLDQRIIDKTHITDEMLAGQPSIEEVLPDFNLFCSGAILVGHNSNDFDYRILTRIAGEQKLRFPAEHEDTMVLAKKLLRTVHNYKLSTVAKYFGIVNENAHRALDDTIATAKVFVELAKML